MADTQSIRNLLLHSGLCVAVGVACLNAQAPMPANFRGAQQPQSGSISVKLTDLRSAPLGGISVTLRNRSTGTEIHAVTAKNGTFRIGTLDGGEYALEADATTLGHGELAGIVVTGGAEAHIQAALKFAPPPPSIAAPTSADALALNPVAPSLTPSANTSLPSRPLEPPRQPPSRASVVQRLPSTAPAPSTINLEARLDAFELDQRSLHPMPTPARYFNEPAPSVSLDATTPRAMQSPAPSPAQLPRFKQINRPTLEIASLNIQPDFRPAPTAHLLLRTPPLPVANLSADTINLDQTVAVLNLVLLTHTDPEVLSTTESASVTTINNHTLQSLPITGRNWQQFLADSPDDLSASSATTPESAPSATRSDTTTIDGISTALAFGVTAGSAPRAALLDPTSSSADHASSSSETDDGPSLRPGEAAVRSVQSFAASSTEMGNRAPGGLHIQTEDGAGPLHGQVFAFDHLNAWGARNPFTHWVQNLGTAANPQYTAQSYSPPDREMIWGASIGSSLHHRKFSWFAAADNARRNDPGVATVKNPAEFFAVPAPTSAAIQLLSAQLGETQSQAYNDFLGVAQPGYAPAGLAQLASLLGPSPRTSTQWSGFLRIDAQLGERNRVSLEEIASTRSAPGGGLTRVSEAYGNRSFGSSHSTRQRTSAHWESYLTPNLLSVAQGAVSRSAFNAPPQTPSAFEQSFLTGNFWGQLPQMVVDSRYGLTIGNPARFGPGSYPDEHAFQAQEQLRWVRGAFILSAGAALNHDADATSQLRNQTGTYHYATVASFIADALAFQKFGYINALDPFNPHNCGATRTRFGSQPCYSYYTQTMGPSEWQMSTNHWAAFATVQRRIGKFAVASIGLRWERQQFPPPIPELANPDLPLTQKLPVPGNNWNPRFSLAVGRARSSWPVLRIGYGMYTGRIPNATILAALTQTGSLHGDLNFLLRPSDDCQRCAGGAPPFPYVFAGQPASAVKPGAVELAANFRNPEIHQAEVSVEQRLPSHVQLTAAAELSLGRRLPIAIDANFDPATNPGTITYAVQDVTGTGPIKGRQITVPFYASWPSPTSPTGTTGRLNPAYQQIAQLSSRANSTYEAVVIRLRRQTSRGLSFSSRYTYSHAMDWNPNETASISGSDVLDPADFDAEYGVSDLDVRHAASASVVFAAPWRFRHAAGVLANGWMISGIGQFHSGLPYSMHTIGSIPEEFTASRTAIAGFGASMNGSGGDNRVYGVSRNAFRYPSAWKADIRIAKRFPIGERREIEFLAESFNFLNHSNVTRIETNGYTIESGGTSGTMPVLCYLTLNTTTDTAGCGTSTTLSGSGVPIAAFGQHIDVNATNYYRERQIQLGLRMRF